MFYCHYETIVTPSIGAASLETHMYLELKPKNKEAIRVEIMPNPAVIKDHP